MARRQAPDGRSSRLLAGSDKPVVVRSRTDATVPQPLRPGLCRAPASCAPHSAALTFGHRLIAPCDIWILLFATQIKHIPRTPMPSLALKPEVTFCVQGVISPLLAAIYLDPLDHLMAEQGYERVGYADDFVVLCRSPRTLPGPWRRCGNGAGRSDPASG